MSRAITNFSSIHLVALTLILIWRHSCDAQVKEFSLTLAGKLAKQKLISGSTHKIFVGLRLILFVLLLTSSHAGLGQTKNVADTSCEAINFEKAGSVVRSSRVENPFDFLPWIAARKRRSATRIAALVDGKPFSYATARDAALKIIEEEDFLPDTGDVRMKIRVELVEVKNCSGGSLDLVYRIYSSQIRPVLSAVPESRVEERKTPERTAGLANVNLPESSPINLTPLGGYDSEDGFWGGARLEVLAKGSGRFGFDSATLEGKGSSEMRAFSIAVGGSRNSEGWLSQLQWRFNFSNYSLPTGAGNLKGGHISAQLSGITKAVVNGNFTFRFGGLLEGGNRQSDLQNTRLTPDTVANSPFGVLKLYGGVASRLRRHTFSASYGLEMGAAGRTARVDWTKHIFDVRHEFWYPLGDHRPLNVESQFTIGRIYVPGKIPLSQRFFGGNNEEFFIPGDSWQIRSNPVIRAIAGRRFYRTSAGDGANRFLSYNLTAAFTVWHRPLVPSELSRDDEFNALLEAQLVNATSFLQLHFLTKDPHYLNMVALVIKPEPRPAIQAALANLKSAVNSIQATQGTQFPEEFSSCLEAIDDANSRATRASQTKGEEQYGFVMSLLSNDEDQLGQVLMACVAQLNGSGALNGNAGIANTGIQLDHLRNQMEAEFGKIDQRVAEKKAQADMTFTRRTVKTLLHDMNVYSISPVMVFDVARLGPGRAGLGGVRYGPGAGLRFELANTTHFTVGYAWNTKRGPSEGAGNVFFSIGLRDLFQ